MRFSRVLLITPPYSHGGYGAAFPLSGLGYIAQSLQDNGFEYSILDMNIGNGMNKLVEKIESYRPDLVGISMMTLDYMNHYKIAKSIAKSFQSIKIIVGGPHVSTFREKVLEDCEEIDYGVVLEGEKSIVELCQGVELSEIKGLIYRNAGKITFNGEREFIHDLDRINFPRYEGFDLCGYVNRRINVLTSRGCPFHCLYCAVNLVIGRKYRIRSSKYVAEEITYWYDRGYRQIGILDDNFSLIKERVYEICNELEKADLRGLELICDNGIRADRVDMDLLKRMKEVGFQKIAFGVEAGNNKMMKVLRRDIKIEIVEQSIRNACDLGFDVVLFFVVGAPEETWKDIEDSASLALRHPVFDAVFGNLIPYPKTDLYDRIIKGSYFLIQPEIYLSNFSHLDTTPIFCTPELSMEERLKAIKYLDTVRRTVRRRNIERKIKHLFFAKKIISWIYVNKHFQRLIHFNSGFRWVTEKIFRLIQRKGLADKQ